MLREERKERRPKVFIINKSGHDYSPAQEFGDLVFLSEGFVEPYDLNIHYREFSEKLQEAQEGDYLLITSLASLNALAGWILGIKGLSLNLLLFKGNKYLERNIKPKLQEEKEV